MKPHILALGDAAWLVAWPHAEMPEAVLQQVHALCKALESSPDRPDGVGEATGGYDTLAVRYHPHTACADEVQQWIADTAEALPAIPVETGHAHEIPVCYAHGDDLEAVARATRLTPDEIIRLHSGAEYLVAMIGFSPGFPYLTGLPKPLHLPRLTTPRDRVEAGSVAIAAGQAGIYPRASPAGWHILGRTDVPLFSPERKGGESLLLPGDRVRFTPVEKIDPPAQAFAPAIRPADADVNVVAPGYFTTIQDLGRPGFEKIGVSPGGAMDRKALRVANLLLGNPEHAAALEITIHGPTLRFARDARVVLVGANSSTGLRHGRAIDVACGDELETGTLTDGMRAILAIDGGIMATVVLGSRSADVRAAFGGQVGRALESGDSLPLGRPPARFPTAIDGTSLAAPQGKLLELRVVPGPQCEWFGPEALHAFHHHSFILGSRQDRMAVRLEGLPVHIARERQMASQPVCTGSIQIPPDGGPIVLMAERQTHGGYPQIASVIHADHGKLARALPGTRLVFRPVTLRDAHAAAIEMERDLARLKAALLCG